MNFYEIRNKLVQGYSLSNLNLTVTFYARVSTDKDAQLNSLDNQISYFKNLITNNPNWTYSPGYIDEGISGSSTKKRINFLKMINDAKNHKFNLILTKEISRFSRNLSDSIHYINELIKYDVGIFFQSNGINTYDPNSEFILNMMSSVAQEEVKRLSSRIKWGHMEAIKKGHILGNSNITGYTKKNHKLIINKEESEKVKTIFTLYATGNYGLNNLALKLYNMGITNTKNNIYDKDTLKRIIENPKYIGYYRGHTTEVIDYKTKKRINIPIEKQIIYKDPSIKPIIEPTLWYQANNILQERSNHIKEKKIIKEISKIYPYTAKLYCTHHLNKFNRIKVRNIPKWVCQKYLKYGTNFCNSPIIKEEDLNTIFKKILLNIFNNKDILKKDILSYYNKTKSNKYPTNIQNKIKLINLKKEKLLELNINNIISNKELFEKTKKYNEEIILLQNNLEEKSKDITINNIITTIDKILLFEDNITPYLNLFLERIDISLTNNIKTNVNLNIYINLNNTIPIIKSPIINKNNYIYLFNNSIIINKYTYNYYIYIKK